MRSNGSIYSDNLYLVGFVLKSMAYETPSSLSIQGYGLGPLLTAPSEAKTSEVSRGSNDIHDSHFANAVRV